METLLKSDGEPTEVARMPKGNFAYVPGGHNAEAVHHDGNEGLKLTFLLSSGGKYLTPVVYTSMDPRKTNELDKLARSILSVCHSADKQTDFVIQNLIDMNCVAVAIYGNLLTGLTLLVAKNGKTTIDPAFVGASLTAELNQFDIKNIELIENQKSDRDFHAEMQLVDALSSKGQRPAGDQIGVSKPCCIFCAEKLDALGIDYSHYHDQIVGSNWIPCSTDSRWW